MAIPVALISALLTGGGALINNKIQNDWIRETNAQNRKAMELERLARDVELTRQRDMEALQADTVARALVDANPANIATQAEESANDPDNKIVMAAEDYNIPTLTGQRTDGPVATEIGKMVADRLAETKDILRAQAVLTAQGTGMQGTQDGLIRMGSDLSTIGSNRRASAGVANLETNVPAADVYKSDSPLGDLLILGGKLFGGLNGDLGSLVNGKIGAGTAANAFFKNGKPAMIGGLY